MKRFCLGVLFAVAGQASWCAGQETSARFSTEAIEVLQATSAPYDLNGGPAQNPPKDDARLKRLSLSADSHVGALAMLSLLQAKLHEASSRLRQPKSREQLAASVDKMLRDHIVKLEDAVRSDDQKVMRAEMFSLAKDFVLQPRKEYDDVVLGALGNQLGGFLLNLYLKDEAVQLAGPGPAGGQKGGIAVRVEDARDRPGSMALTNKTGSALHHCLIVTRMVPDRSIGVSLGALNELLPHLAGGVGAKEVAEGTVKSNRLRAVISQLEQGVFIYVPEIPAGATVRTNLCPAEWLRLAQEAKLSIWCDELTALDVQAANLDQARPPRPKAEDLGPLGFPKGYKFSPPTPPGAGQGRIARGPASNGRFGGAGAAPGLPGLGGAGAGAGPMDGRLAPPPAIRRNAGDPDGVSLKRGGAGASKGLARGGNGSAKADASAKSDSSPPPRAASTGPAFKALKKATFITLVPLEDSQRAKGYVFPTCVPSGGSYRTNGKEIALDYAPPAMLKAVAEGPDAYVAIGQDRAKGQTYLVLVPKERVEGGKN